MILTSLAQIDQNLLSMTGVIATILAVIFALGAFFNSRNRRKHMQDLERSQKEEQLMHFRPAPTHHPGRSTRPGNSHRPHHSSRPSATLHPDKTPPVAKAVTESKGPEESKRDKKDASTQMLFRKVRPTGTESDVETPDEDEELYVWE